MHVAFRHRILTEKSVREFDHLQIEAGATASCINVHYGATIFVEITSH
jgi:hypothetical protein